MLIPGPLAPHLEFERTAAAETGALLVAGVDEAGRGALAGPVVAAAVQLPLADEPACARLVDVRDSKLLTAARREALYTVVCETVAAYAIAHVPAAWIDENGIIAATRRAMTAATGQLRPPAQAILVDGPLRLVNLNVPQYPIVRGDRQSLSIAAASILAKVGRDRYMISLAERYPEYGFERHKGYGTAEHLTALGRFGPCPEHRLSFSPLRAGLF